MRVSVPVFARKRSAGLWPQFTLAKRSAFGVSISATSNGHVPFWIRYRADLGIQPFHLLEHVSIMIRFQPPNLPRSPPSRVPREHLFQPRRQSQPGSYAVNRNIVVIIATNTPKRQHHAGYIQSSNRWVFPREKQALDLPGQLHILEQVVSLLLNGLGQRFALRPYIVESDKQQTRSTRSPRGCGRSVSLN